MLRILAFTLTVSLLACGGSKQGQGPTQPTAGPDAPAPERVVALFEALAADVVAAASDCEAIAGLLSKWTETHRDSYGELSGESARTEMAKADRLAQEDRLRAALTTIVDAVAGCGSNPQAQAAYTQFDVLVDPQ